MKTAIITIGDEILIGQIVDTNSAWIAEKMTVAGFAIEEMVSIGDDAKQIKDTIDDVFKRVDVILMTGGLGPTKDDITKKTLCDYFGTELIFDETVLDNLKQVISWTSINKLTHDQAYVPKDCTVIQNKVGTAPITWFERNGKVLVSMPGVPYEMRNVMENEIISRLTQHFDTESYIKQVFIVAGYTESALAIHISDFENNLPKGFGLAYLPSLGFMKLRLFVKGEQRRPELETEVLKLKALLGKAIIAEEDIALEAILSKKLIEKGLTIGTAESCTGGNIAHMITSVAGASRYFKGSVVSYANEIKKNLLNVRAETLDSFGAVSEEVVLEMAAGVIDVLNTDCAISVSGIAGPDGGSDEKPVGTVWICTSYKGNCQARKYNLGKYREANIMKASNAAILQMLNMLD